MARYIKPNVTQEELKAAIIACSEDHGGDDVFYLALYDAVYTPKVEKDLSKIESEYENISCIPGEFRMPGFTPGWDTIHGSAVLWIGLGGDAEQPFAAVLYLDNKNSLRAYIPKDGNCYDKKHKIAYGCMWWEEYGEECGAPVFGEEGFNEAMNIKFNDEQLRADAANRIQIA